MTIYNLYVFDREGACVFYAKWKRSRESSVTRDEEFKLLYGLLVSMNSFVTRLSPINNKCTFKSFQTNNYKLSYFETATSLKFVVNTDVGASGTHELLRQIYAEAYVPYVSKNPVAMANHFITSNLFIDKVNSLVQNHSAYV